MKIRRIALVAAAALIPLVTPSAAHATDNVICVGNPAGVTCNAKVATLQQAIAAANNNGLADTIYVAPGHYGDGPWTITGTTEPLTLEGAGQGQTFLELPAAAGIQTYLGVTGATVKDLTLSMAADQSDGDVGISLTNASAQRVTVDGPGTNGAVGIKVTSGSVAGATIDLPRNEVASTRGIFSVGAASVSDTTITAGEAFRHAGPGSTSTVSRVVLSASTSGISSQGGSVVVDDAFIDLNNESYGAGILASNENPSTASKSVIANHVTIVGGGSGSSGVRAWSIAPAAVQQSAVQLDNSIVDGPAIDLDAQALNNGSQGANSTATITTTYSDWSTKSAQPGTGGTATITSGAGHLDVDPKFANPAGGDFRLSAGSPLIDRGRPGTGAPTLDLDRHARVVDGTGDGVAVRDLGAYEAPKVPDVVAPGTTISTHPARKASKKRVTFRFRATEHATFQCRLDAKAWHACPTPYTVSVTRGWHTLQVRARDAAGNLDKTPAAWRFKRV